MRIVSTVLLVLVATRAWAGLDLDETVFSEPSLGVRLPIPEGWRASTQTGYPGLLLLLQATGYRSRIMVGGSYLTPGKTLPQFIVENASGLRALGMTVTHLQPTSQQGRSVWEVTAQAGRDVGIRQLIFAQGHRVITLTLAGPTQELPHLQAELQQVLASLAIL